MKVTNIVLSIIILLLALALAVSSFFLYEKREIMLNGWEKLTTTINETAKEMDKNSGFECPASCIKLGLVIYFTYGNIHVSMLFSQIILPVPSSILKRQVRWSGIPISFRIFHSLL